MQHARNVLRGTVALGTFLLGSALLVAACASTGSGGSAATGSELWSQNCGRCHNIRTPSDLSDSEWDAAMLHMRVRANLTAHEYREIRKFIEASN